MASLSSYSAQLLRHFEVKGWKTALVRNYEQIFQERAEYLSKFYENPENRWGLIFSSRRMYVLSFVKIFCAQFAELWSS